MTRSGSLSIAPAPDATPQTRRLLRLIEPDIREIRPRNVLCCGGALPADAQSFAAQLGVPSSTRLANPIDLAQSPGEFEVVVCAGLLERTPTADLDGILQQLRGISERIIFQISTCARSLSPDESTPNRTVRYADWWRPKLRQFFDHVEPIATSANDVVFKTWPGSRWKSPIRTWRRFQSTAALRRESIDLWDQPEHDVDRPAAACLSCEAASPTYLGDKNGYHVWKCRQCGLIFVDPMPSEAEIDEFYSQHPRNDKYLRKSDGKYRRARWRILRLKGRVPGRRFLDIGCSIGSSVAAARDAGFEATGVDLDPQSIEFAQQHYPGCRFLHTSSTALARAGETFDLIFCTEVIEHVTDPEAFVDDLRALLNPGGIVFLTTPHGTHFRLPQDILSWYGLKPPEHIVLFGRRSITALFERRGLQVLSAPPRLKTSLKVVARRAA